VKSEEGRVKSEKKRALFKNASENSEAFLFSAF
jgi:hypothetical protein